MNDQINPQAFKARLLQANPNAVASDGRRYADIDATELTNKAISVHPDGVTKDGIPYKNFAGSDNSGTQTPSDQGPPSLLSSIGHLIGSGAKVVGNFAGSMAKDVADTLVVKPATYFGQAVGAGLLKGANYVSGGAVDRNVHERTGQSLDDRLSQTISAPSYNPLTGNVEGMKPFGEGGGTQIAVNALKTASDLIPFAKGATGLAAPLGRAYAGIEGAGDYVTGKVGQYAAPWLGRVIGNGVKGGLQAYPLDVANQLQDGDSVGDSFKPGLTTALGFGVPAVLQGVKETAPLVRNLLSKTSGVGKEAFSTNDIPFKRDKVGIHIGNVSTDDAIATGREATTQTRAEASKYWDDNMPDLQKTYHGTRMGLPDAKIKNLQKISDEFALDAEAIPQNLKSFSVNEAVKLNKALNSVLNSGSTDASPKGHIVREFANDFKGRITSTFRPNVDAVARDAIGEMKIGLEYSGYTDASNALDNVDLKGIKNVSEIPDRVRAVLGEHADDPVISDAIKNHTTSAGQVMSDTPSVGGFLEGYGEKVKPLTTLKQVFNSYDATTENPAKLAQAKSKLFTIFNDNKEDFIRNFEDIEQKTGIPIATQLKALQFHDALPHLSGHGLDPAGLIRLALSVTGLGSPRGASYLNAINNALSKSSGFLSGNPAARQVLIEAMQGLQGKIAPIGTADKSDQ